ncbi:recombinase family protein [Salinispora mooreana]|uniref:recombinase family protein n=1 Tax=Salinispora mooreana TaxID=999545 RepID=UPI000382BD38|nr:recombinase family protein [Salinispora mooreana]
MAARNRARKPKEQAATGTVRVAVYTRRSTDEEHQPFSIEAQDTKLAAYVASQPGWHIVERFTDDASGASMERPGLRKALAAAKAARYDLLLVYRLDRFTRRIRDLAVLMDELEKADVHFRSATEPFDTSTPAGRMLVQMLGVFAEFEREIIIDRVRNGMERKAAKGKWTGGPVPYGYQLDRDLDIPVPDQAEAAVVRQIFTAYARTRVGTRSIATALNQRGIRTKTGKPWSGYTIGRMLSNRVYLGEKVFGDINVPGAHDPIINPDLFDEVQEIMSTRGEPGSKRAASNSDYDLTGLITCPACGLKYIGTSAQGRSRTYRYYTCFSRIRYGSHGCDAPRLPAEEIDQAVFAALLGLYSDTDLIADAIHAERQHRAGQYESHRAELAAIGREIEQAEDAMDRYLTAFETGALDADTCGQRVRDLKIRLERLARRRDDLEHALTTAPGKPSQKAIDQLRRDLAHVFRHGTPGQRKALIEANIAEIHFDGDKLVPVFKIPEEATEPVENSTGSSAAAVRAMEPVVRRQGLEPRTRGLRAGVDPCFAVPARPISPCTGRFRPVLPDARTTRSTRRRPCPRRPSTR